MGNTITCNLPYNHTFSIFSPYNGESVEQYIKIVNVEGLNDCYADISSIERVGIDGALYTGRKVTYKTLTVTFDVEDARIKWFDFYSFFNKTAVYTIYWDNKYIHAAVSKIDNHFFGNVPRRATVVFECDAAYWSQDLTISSNLTIEGTAATQLTYIDILGVQDILPDFYFTFGAQVTQSIAGLSLVSVSSSDNKYRYDFAFSSSIIAAAGGAIQWDRKRPNYVNYLSGSSWKSALLTTYPQEGARVRLGDTYAVTLQQSSDNIAQTLNIKTSGIIRDYN